MKTFTLFCLAMCASMATFAQTVGGTKVIGGGISYSSTSSSQIDGDDVKTTQFSFTPSFGVFVADQILIGVNVGFSSSKTPFLGVDTKMSSVSAGPFFRYYKHTANESFAFFAQAAVNYTGGKTTDYLDNENKFKTIEAVVSPGFAYFLNEHWGGEIWFRGIAFINTDPDTDTDDDNSSTFQFNINSLSPNIGIRYYFK